MGRVNDLIKDAGKNLSAKELQRISEQTGLTPASIVARAENAGVNARPSAQEFVNTATQAQIAAQKERASSAAPAGTTASFSTSPQGDISVSYIPSSGSSAGVSSAAGAGGGSTSGLPTASTTPTVSFPEFDTATRQALERISQDSQTERLKYEIDNRIPEIQAKAQGEIDLQKIVNAGYKNIKRLESTSSMFSSLMGAFNF